MANNTVCRDRQTAFLHRLKPVAPCLFLVDAAGTEIGLPRRQHHLSQGLHVYILFFGWSIRVERIDVELRGRIDVAPEPRSSQPVQQIGASVDVRFLF
ncbi:MAG: hypothetical protein BWY06_03092 [Candidatus Latescibacteria bacterium ADurb.Bin168]|nr:MAG: hypothetical protein BWY06_03092 [Candidatus Latescibacteria bacterium ADurb.Bin168]